MARLDFDRLSYGDGKRHAGEDGEERQGRPYASACGGTRGRHDKRRRSRPLALNLGYIADSASPACWSQRARAVEAAWAHESGSSRRRSTVATGLFARFSNPRPSFIS